MRTNKKLDYFITKYLKGNFISLFLFTGWTSLFAEAHGYTKWILRAKGV